MAARADRRTAAGALLIALVSLAATSAATAQRVDGTLDLGGAAIRYADSINTSAAVLSPSVRLAWPAATITAGGSVARLGTGDWAAQGNLGASAFTAPLAGLRAEFAGGLGGSDRAGASTGQVQALGRIHLQRIQWGLWGGGGAGRAWAGSGSPWRTTAFADAGAWYRGGGFTAVFTATPTWIGDSLRYTDLGLAARIVTGRAELGASVGARSGQGLVPTAGSGTVWGALGAVIWVGQRVAIVASAGTYPPDLEQGFPNGRFATLGLRLSNHATDRMPARGSAGETGQARPDAGQAGGAGVTGLEVRSNGDVRTIRLRAPDAVSVEAASDVTDWMPVELARTADGWWTASVSAPPGLHQLSLRIDHGAWAAPPGLVLVRDEFGGAAGLWNVP